MLNYIHNNQKEKCCFDHGGKPFAVNLKNAAIQNPFFRTSLWTGKSFQLTLMCIEAGDDIGLECHSDVDQFIYIESGQGCTVMGDCKEHLELEMNVCANFGIFVPAGTWHNIINTGRCPLKVFSIYAPPEHPKCTQEKTKAEAMENEKY